MPPGPITTSPEPARPPAALRRAPEQRQMALIVGLAFFLNFVFGMLLQTRHFRAGLVVSQILFIAGPVLLSLRLFYLDPGAILPFRRPTGAALAAAVFGTVGLNHLLNLLGAWQERVFPTPESIRMLFESQFVYRGPADFALLLVVFAVVPAICEEALFRGFVQAGFLQIFESAPAGIILTALLFAAFHLNPWIFIGVLGLGLFLGLLAQRTGSLVPPILGHALNNVLSISATAWSGSASEAQGTWWSIVGALLLVGLALALLRRARA